ncbi:hypothetical protein AOLI_G00055910 [Acnodon oligacanthus]
MDLNWVSSSSGCSRRMAGAGASLGLHKPGLAKLCVESFVSQNSLAEHSFGDETRQGFRACFPSSRGAVCALSGFPYFQGPCEQYSEDSDRTSLQTPTRVQKCRTSR